MQKDRFAAFSDAVFAVIITIMVLELKAPHDSSLESLVALWPVFLSYLLSFLYVAIYWNNHHHMLHAVGRVNGAVLWANMHLLFWLSLIPFTTAWMGENHFMSWPSAVYGGVLLMAALAYALLQNTLIRAQGPSSVLARAIGRDIKGRISPVLYALGIGLAFVNPVLSGAVYVGVALMWLVPDRRIEDNITQKDELIH